MPQVIRRTPETEKASQYSYRDLLRDIIKKKLESSGAQSRRMLSGKMTEEDVADVGLSGVGGMLKVAGTGKLLAGLVKSLAEARNVAKLSGFGEKYVDLTANRFFQKQAKALREAMLVPEKEYRRIKDIRWSKLEGKEPGIQGEYSPHENIIRLFAGGPEEGTVFHEFTHPRQLMPEKSEALLAKALVGFEAELRPRLSMKGIDPKTFYYSFSPTERHARAMEKFSKKGNINYDEFYREALRREVNTAEEGMRKLGEEDLVKVMWESSFGFR